MLYELHLRSHFWTNFNDSEKSGFLPFGDLFWVILFSQICNQFSHQLSFWFGAYLFLGTWDLNWVEQVPETEWNRVQKLSEWLATNFSLDRVSLDKQVQNWLLFTSQLGVKARQSYPKCLYCTHRVPEINFWKI